MKYSVCIIALAVMPFSLFAQTKTAVRKPASSVSRPAQTAVKPVTTASTKEVAAPVKVAPSQPVAEAPAAPVAVVQSAPVEVAPVATTNTTKPASPKAVKESNFRVGFRVGGNSSTIGGVDPSSLGIGLQLARVTGFHGGVIFNIGGPTFSVQPEVLYSQYGVKFAYGSDYLQLKYNVVEVPVLLKVSFGQPNLRFFVNAGPIGSYALSGTISVKEGGQSDSQSVDMGQEGRFSYGATGGLGVALKAGPGSVLLEGRYNYLMVNQEDGSTTKPQNAMVSVGYLIPLGGR
ncbi:hypothetical protein GCM10028805_65740 [Spirosoma harenae]